jgi:hypothetical protein
MSKILAVDLGKFNRIPLVFAIFSHRFDFSRFQVERNYRLPHKERLGDFKVLQRASVTWTGI